MTPSHRVRLVPAVGLAVAVGAASLIGSPLPVVAQETGVADILDTTTRAASVNDRVRGALLERQDFQASELWFSSDHLGNVLELRTLAAAGDHVAVTFEGNSTVQRAIDPVTVTERIGRTAFLGAMTGTDLPMERVWMLDEMPKWADPDIVVWGVSSNAFFLPCDIQADVQRISQPISLRDAAFSGLPAAAGVAPEELLLGSGATTYPDNAFLESFRFQRPGPLGRRRAFNGRDPKVAEEPGFVKQAYRNPTPCSAYYDVVAQTVNGLVADGRRVIVVNMPQPGYLKAVHPDGAAGHDRVMGEVLAAASRAGAETLDLGSAVPDELFWDWIHVNTEGRAMVTGMILDQVDLTTP